ncbi:MAG TPA: MBL fold metallo-hydrolase [Bacteroidia bacterium]|jgi:hydroxyacylglutathione hydrolase|nr:MBL fold metallo-hydrolase [Bacteroidia bacterium]
MLNQKIFTFNLFAENTYLLYNEKGDAIIIDPGCSNPQECTTMANYIEEQKLKPVRLLLTHAHLDHILGNDFVYRKYGLAPYMHKEDLKLLHALEYSATFYGLDGAAPSPEPAGFLNEGDIITLGNEKLSVIFAPGHSPGSICFYSETEQKLWGGDVLFRQSIGRTDLPGGDFDTLAHHIRTKLFTLPEEVAVFSGHGLPTSIGFEKKNNPFVGELAQQR